MSERILFPQFRDEQGDSRYPFTDGSKLQPSEVTLTIDPACFVDASFHPIGGGESIYLDQMIVSPLNFKFVVKTSNPGVTISGVYDWRDPPSSNVLSFYDEYGRPAGIVLVNPEQMKQFLSWGDGTYTFGLRVAQFVATTFIPAKEPGVRAIQSDSGANFFTGDVWIIGDDGVVVRAEGNNVIRVDVVGVPLYKRVACDDAAAAAPAKKFLKTINGCGPDEFGNFTITATEKNLPANREDTVLRVYPSTNGLVFEALGGSA
jgi:hypothetical protein